MKEYIGDFLTRIRNGYNSKLGKILIHPHASNSCFKLLEILRDEGYIWGFKEVIRKNKGKKEIIVYLKYTCTGTPAIQNIFMISKPGRKFYWTTNSLWKPKAFSGILILNTTKGFLTDRDARLLNIGGELVCGIY